MERDGETISLYVDEAAYDTARPRRRRLRPVPHRGQPLQGPRLRDDRRTRSTAASATPSRYQDYDTSIHGVLARPGRPRRAGLSRLPRQARHAEEERSPPRRPSPRNVPELCAAVPPRGREGGAAASTPTVPDIVAELHDSIHGKGLIESGLVVTATCTRLPHGPPRAAARTTRSRRSTPTTSPDTCGTCHHGIEETFRTSDPLPPASRTTGGELPTCEDCHTSHTITRHRRARLPHADDGPVRAVPRDRGRDLLRHLPRQGLAAGLGGRGQVLRLPRHPRHPPTQRSRLAAQPGQHRRDLRAVPRRAPTGGSPAT